ncbi:hypothetical protein ND973_28995 [Vibrio diabolicus]|nr:hypothetical protein [Vibrio diabolicus]
MFKIYLIQIFLRTLQNFKSSWSDLSLEFIRIYKLDEYLDLDDEIKRLESLVAEQS